MRVVARADNHLRARHPGRGRGRVRTGGRLRPGARDGRAAGGHRRHDPRPPDPWRGLPRGEPAGAGRGAAHLAGEGAGHILVSAGPPRRPCVWRNRVARYVHCSGGRRGPDEDDYNAPDVPAQTRAHGVREHLGVLDLLGRSSACSARKLRRHQTPWMTEMFIPRPT